MENHFFILSRLGFILNGFCSPLNVFLSYYYFLFLAPWPWLPGCSAFQRIPRPLWTLGVFDSFEVPLKGKVQNIKAPLDLRRKKSCSGTEAPWTLSDGPYGRARTVCVFLSKVDGASFSLSTRASRPSPTPHTAHQKKLGVKLGGGRELSSMVNNS